MIDLHVHTNYSDETWDVKRLLPDVKDVVKKIHNAGGKVFLVHLYKYLLRDYKNYLDSLIKDKLIDGIGLYHCSFMDEQINYLYDYCKDNNMLMSGGSDCIKN